MASLSKTYSRRGNTVTASLEIPDLLFYPDRLERRIATVVKNVAERHMKRVMTKARRGYKFEPLHSSFTVQTKVSAPAHEAGAEMSTSDAIFGPVEYGRQPFTWVPPNRGSPGTGLEGWIARLPQNPRPPHTRPLTPFLAARAIFQHGIQAKHVVTDALTAEIDGFGDDLATAVYGVLAGV